MNIDMSISISLCAFSLLTTIGILRSRLPSLGLPFAYIAILQLNNVPGAIAHMARPELFRTTYFVEIGIWQTAIASVCFSLGLLGFRTLSNAPASYLVQQTKISRINPQLTFPTGSILRTRFLLFCLLGGWVFIYGLTPLQGISSLGAIIEKGGAIWMLGVMLGLRDAVARSDIFKCTLWLSALAVYPTLMLILGGFLSYGSAAAIIVLSILIVSVRSYFRIVMATVLISFLGVTVFVNYFIGRDRIREIVWSSATFEDRVAVVSDVFSSITILDLSIDEHAIALNERLNQNYFAGLAASNLNDGFAQYRYFQQFYEALISPIPRALWPDKPVFGGSGSIVKDMTGLTLSEDTSWGVGQVMELYISFGWPSLIIGFGALGWIFGRLDCAAALAERRGDIRTLLVCFLPTVALTQPLGSLVEIVGGAFAAFFSALGWNYLWTLLMKRQKFKMPPASAQR